VKIFLYYVGKARDAHANSMAEEYVKRSDRYVRCEMREIQPERFDPWAKHPSATKILLDPGGRSFDSPQFSKLVAKAEQESRDLVFLIGGATGLPAVWHDRGGILFSLSAMTYPHELARVMLAEQIYRALATLRGHPYPK
jgi:23S rRNA (pseudouridine1915-N3)-methyltransferase